MPSALVVRCQTYLPDCHVGVALDHVVMSEWLDAELPTPYSTAVITLESAARPPMVTPPAIETPDPPMAMWPSPSNWMYAEVPPMVKGMVSENVMPVPVSACRIVPSGSTMNTPAT